MSTKFKQQYKLPTPRITKGVFGLRIFFKLSYCRGDLQYFYYFLAKYEQFTEK
jgi:hypothetical protein